MGEAVPQSIEVPGGMPPHRAIYQRRERRSRGRLHEVPQAAGNLPTAASGLQAIVTPTLATGPGGTTLTQIGSIAGGGPRLVIPLPAVLATATAMTTGSVSPTPAAIATAAASGTSDLPSIALDSEWFSIQAYPEVLRPYLSTGYTFDIMPTTPGDWIAKTALFLRVSYNKLKVVGLELQLARGLRELFDELVKPGPGNTALHPYGENETTNNGYMILAYVLSTLLWKNGANRPLRNYTEATYPGVIVASYVQRLTAYYADLSKAMKLTNPYLHAGGRGQTTDTSVLKREDSLQSSVPALNYLPIITGDMRMVAEYVTGRKPSLVGDCDSDTYFALQDAALNVPNLSDAVAKKFIALKRPDRTAPGYQSTINTRCLLYYNLITGKMKPDDLIAGSTAP